MNNYKLEKDISKATKWSSATEIASKFVSPATNMILARILTPDAFGVVATVTMIISFADMFTDAGFQKYLIQHEFDDEKEKNKAANVAFLTNIGISLLLWGIIAIFSEKIATLVGNSGLGNVITVACIQLPLTAFSSIQMALYKRDFDFKTLFLIRIISVSMPFLVTIPLAMMNLSYWALIIGTICGQLSNAIILTIKSKWKPRLFYDLNLLVKMLSFSVWSLVEAVSIWLTAWLDAFIIGSALNENYLGLYRTSITVVNSFMGIITASVIPVLFSALSRLQNDELAFKAMFYKTQRTVAYLVFPMGVGVFLYRDFATKILLGEQWAEAADIIGIWAITSAIVIVFSYFNSEVYRSKGRPKISFFAQILHLSFLVPTCLISLKYGFWTLVYARALIRLQGVLVGFIIMQLVMDFNIVITIKNNIKPILCTFIMCCVSLILKQLSDSLLWSIISISICVVIYGITMLVLSSEDAKIFRRILARDI